MKKLNFYFIILFISISILSVFFVVLFCKATIEPKKTDFNDVIQYLNMSKKIIFEKLGTNYKIVETGAEGVITGYYYKGLGITFTFSDTGSVSWIECNEKVDINGTKAGMNFEQIQRILGKTTIVESWVETPENKAYIIRYKISSAIVFFTSYNKDGRNSSVHVVRDK